MWRVAVWNRKGGCGKSTIVASLAVLAAADGARIAVIDCDPQNSIASWSSAREAESPVVAAVPLPTLESVLDLAAADGYDGAFVDMPGSLGPGEQRALKLVDLVLIPARPTAFDLVAAIASVDVAKSAGAHPVVVLSMVRSRGREADDVRSALAQHATVLSTEIGERIAFQTAIAGGQGVTESEPASAAADEIRALLTDLRSVIITHA